MLQEFVKHIAVANLCSAIFSLQDGSVARPALSFPLKLSFPSCLQKPSQWLGSWLTEFVASHADKLCASISYLIHLLPLSATPLLPLQDPWVARACKCWLGECQNEHYRKGVCNIFSLFCLPSAIVWCNFRTTYSCWGKELFWGKVCVVLF